MELPSATYTWKLDTTNALKLKAAEGHYYQSPMISMVGFIWYFRFYPDYKSEGKESHFFIYLCRLPERCSTINVNYSARLAETEDCHQANNKVFIDSGDNWGSLKPRKILDITKMTVTFNVSLIAVHDNDGKDITSQYVNGANIEQKMDAKPKIDGNIADELQVYEVRLQSITTQMEQLTSKVAAIEEIMKDIKLRNNEEQKFDGNELQKQIDEINTKITKILSSNNNVDNGMDENKQEFKNWVYNTLKLPEYYKVFVENGIETLNVVQLCTANELTAIGITLIGHRMKILQEIIKLAQKPENQPAEGGTAFI